MRDSRRSTRSQYRALGLAPGAPLADVHRAYQRRRALYDESSLATYTLLTPEERAREVARLEAAYRAILAEVNASRGAGVSFQRTVKPAMGADPVDVPEDGPPGPTLRHAREIRGFSLDDLAAETKIRPPLLAALESQRLDELPAPVFVRGFVIQCARALGVRGPEGLAQRYLELFEQENDDSEG